jgi:hypothetical protein
MASTKWVIKGSEFNNCNCSYGCPCQFNALPTHGNCRSLAGIQIEEGYFGDIRRLARLVSGRACGASGRG